MNSEFLLKLSYLTIGLSVAILLSVRQEVGASEVGGGVTVSGVGAWSLNIEMVGNVDSNSTGTASWNSAGGKTDYLSFIDSGTGIYGAYLMIHLNSSIFNYTGNGSGNTGLVKGTNLYIIAKNNSSPSLGTNDTSKTANLVTAESCGQAQVTDILFHSLFYSSAKSNSVRIGTNNKIIFRISTPCTTSTRLNFEKVKISYPRLTTSGTYSNSLILTAIDGSP